MKHTFVLDENIFIQSFTCQNVKNSHDGPKDDFKSLRLIITILDECHKIGLNPKLKAKYQEKSKKLENCGKVFNAAKVWNQFLTRNDKQRWCNSCIRDLPSNLEDDRHVIEPTLFLSGILVTTDEKLKERLNEWSKEKGFDFIIKGPADALQFLSNSS